MDQELLSFLENALQTSGFFQWGLLPKEALTFSPEVRGMCAANRCGCYGKTWACPPAVGTLEECRAQCDPYSHLLLFSCKYDLEDSFDFEGMTEAGLRFKQQADALDALIAPRLSSYLLFSNESCHRCSTCTYPNAPCRFPESLHPSLEGYGFQVSVLAGKAGINYINGANTVTYFGGIMFSF